MDEQQTITRRQALQQAAVMLGGALAASTVAAVLTDGARVAWAAEPALGETAWAASTLTARQLETVATIADLIIPPTDTPGARAAGVHRLVDALLTSHYKAPERDRFLAGLTGVDVRARRRHGKAFLDLTPAQRLALVTAIDLEAYPAAGAIAQAEKDQKPPPRDVIVGPGGGTGPVPQQTPADVEGETEAVRTEMGSNWFWRRMKEVTLAGYYTSRPGATQELRVNPMGLWKGDIPYRRGDRGWA